MPHEHDERNHDSSHEHPTGDPDHRGDSQATDDRTKRGEARAASDREQGAGGSEER
jgi:hypothetical protein